MNTHLQGLIDAANAGQLAARLGMSADKCPYPMNSETASHWLGAFDAEVRVSWQLGRIRSGAQYSFMEAAE